MKRHYMDACYGITAVDEMENEAAQHRRQIGNSIFDLSEFIYYI